MTQEEKLKVVLFGLDLGEYDMDRSMDELSALAEANNMEAVAVVTQKRDTPEAAAYLGEGRLAEGKLLCRNLGAGCAIFDAELSGSQLRNLSDLLDVEVLDRTMLILEIFKNRAVTGEGKLQTELATLRYRLPRLAGLGTALSRQGGGGAGAKGHARQGLLPHAANAYQPGDGLHQLSPALRGVKIGVDFFLVHGVIPPRSPPHGRRSAHPGIYRPYTGRPGAAWPQKAPTCGRRKRSFGPEGR